MLSDSFNAQNAPSFDSRSQRSAGMRKIGRYEILADEHGKSQLLGSGSAGKTYKARHELLGTTVALKVIHDALVHDPEARQRFLNEARAVAALKHPHIAQLVDCDEHDGALFCAFEFCDAGTLDGYLSPSAPMAEKTALLYGMQAAEALAYVHEKGYLHRDLKPTNLMLSMVPGTDQATLKIIDFGLVKSLGQASELTRKGMFRGTLLYTSPEQLRNEGMDERANVPALDERADVFALGMTLWHLLSGGPPMDLDSHEITRLRLSGISHAEALPQSFHPSIRALLRQMLRPELARRARNMRAVLAGMRECLTMMERPRRQVKQSASVQEQPSPTSSMSKENAKGLSGLASAATSEPPRKHSQPQPGAGLDAASDTDSTPAKPVSAKPSAPSLVSFAMSLHDKFELLEADAGVHTETGTSYRARRLSNGMIVRLTSLHSFLANDPAVLRGLRSLVEKVPRAHGGFFIRPLNIIRFTDQVALVEERVEGPTLLDLLRVRQRLPLQEAGALLQQLAEACDLAVAAGIPALDLAAHHVVLNYRGMTAVHGRTHETAARLLAGSINDWPQFRVRLGVDYAVEEGREEDMAWLFSRLAYQLLSGLPAPAGTATARRSYAPVAGLSENGNRLLAKLVMREMIADSSTQFVRSLLQMENLSMS